MALLAALVVVGAPILLRPAEVLYSRHSDILAQHLPFRHLLAKSLRAHGRLPLWNPTAFGGMPLVGDPQSGLFYPPNWLHALTPVEHCGAWFGPLLLLHLAAGGLGMLWWLGGHGLAPLSRLTGALAFVLAGKWFYHLAVPGHVVFLPLMLLPWHCGLVDRLWRSPDRRRAAVLATTLALTIVGCHPQMLLFLALLLVAYTVVVAVASARSQPGAAATANGERPVEGPCAPSALPPSALFRKGRRGCRRAPLVHLSLAVALALMASAVHWLPILAAREHWVRGAGMTYAAAARHSLTFADLFGFLVPVMSGPGKWERTIYTGVAAMALASLAWCARPLRAIVWLSYVLTGFSIWYALGENGGVHRFFFESVPGFGLVRIPTRILLLLGFPIGCLAAAGVEALVQRPRSASVISMTLALVAGAAVLGWIAPGGAALPATFALVVPALVWLVALRGAAFWAALLASACVFGELACFAIPLVQTRPLAEALGHNPLVDRLHRRLGHGRVLPINTSGHHMANALPIAYCTIHDIESVRGFNPLVPMATYRWLHQAVGGLPLEPDAGRTGIPNFPLKNFTPLDLLNVRWIVSNRPLELPGWRLVERFDALRVYHFVMKEGGRRLLPQTWLYENGRVFPRAGLVRQALHVEDVDAAIERLGTVDPRTVVLTEATDWTEVFPGEFRQAEVKHGGDEIELFVDAGAGGYLVTSEMWYPGWRAWDNGIPVEVRRANGIFCAFKLGPGRHRLHLAYRPADYQLGRALSLAGIALLLLCLSRRPTRLAAQPTEATAL